MKSLKEIQEMAGEIAGEMGLFVVDVEVAAGNAVRVEIDSMTGVDVGTCRAFSRRLEEGMDRDGSSTAFDALCTDAVLQGLRLRRKAAGAGTVERYDLDGKLVMGGWAAFEAHVYWDLDTDDLVISGSAFAGDVSVLV